MGLLSDRIAKRLEKFDKTKLLEMLKNGIYEVRFIKVTTGEERTMHITLDQKYISGNVNYAGANEDTVNESAPVVAMDGVTAEEKPKRKRPVDPDLIGAWSVDDKGWRSFKISSMISFNPVKEPSNG